MKKVDITVGDLRVASAEAGLDPDRYNYVETEKGFSIRKGILSVGMLVFELDARLLVDVLNTREKLDDFVYNKGTGTDPLGGLFE